MKKFICTTTISSPTDALLKFIEMKDWTVIVAGDIKTPHEEYQNLNLIYISSEQQADEYPYLSELTGWTCIQRRNFAFIEAYKRKCDIIATVDDDNIPLEKWGKSLYLNESVRTKIYTSNKTNCFDPIKVTKYNPFYELWHRGFPIQQLNKREYFYSEGNVSVDIQADFWNFDPDIDAIARMNSKEIIFDNNSFPFSTNLITPFNSQNTFLSKEVLPYYFVLPHVGRMDDIWIAYYITALGYRVLFNKPSVNQIRHKHDLTKDLMNEIIGYKNTNKLIRDLYKNPENFFDYLPSKTIKAYEEYRNIMEGLRYE